MVDKLIHEAVKNVMRGKESNYFSRILSEKQQFTSVLDGDHTKSGLGQLEEMEQAIELLSDAVTVLLAIVLDKKLISLRDLKFSLREGHRIEIKEEKRAIPTGLKL